MALKAIIVKDVMRKILFLVALIHVSSASCVGGYNPFSEVYLPVGLGAVSGVLVGGYVTCKLARAFRCSCKPNSSSLAKIGTFGLNSAGTGGAILGGLVAAGTTGVVATLIASQFFDPNRCLIREIDTLFYYLQHAQFQRR